MSAPSGRPPLADRPEGGHSLISLFIETLAPTGVMESPEKKILFAAVFGGVFITVCRARLRAHL